MKQVLLILWLLLTVQPVFAQTTYWQQEVNYHIDVSLQDKDHTLDGFARIEYINRSPDTLRFIWFHLWPNAYKTDRTAFSDQLLENGNTSFYFSGADQKGYINRLGFKVNGTVAETEDHPQHIDIVKLLLPSPLPPGGSISITTPFHVKLPYNFSRGGHEGESYQVTQWYPKPAVYDAHGWHPMPYLDQGEFYSEFGSFDVKITVPENYVVAATGTLQEEKEKEWLKGREQYTWVPGQVKEKNKYGQIRTVHILYPASAIATKTLTFRQDKIHDFAWFADKRFIVKQDTCLLPSGKIIQVGAYYTPAYRSAWDSALTYAKAAVRFYSTAVGEYPYAVVSVVQGPGSFGGGMEYPTITVLSPYARGESLDGLIAHEIGHNWFYGALASNEREYPWMDEGINTYYERQYLEARYGRRYKGENELYYRQVISRNDQPIATPSERFSDINYGLIAYNKTADWLQYLAGTLPPGQLDAAIRHYYRQWQFRHPSPHDLQQALRAGGANLADSAFTLLYHKGLLPDQHPQGTSFVTPFTAKAMVTASAGNKKNLLLLTPAFGFNSYDKLMVGAAFTNYIRSFSRFRFFIAPFYAVGSKKLTGIGTANYSFYPATGLFRQLRIGLNGAAFTADRYTAPDRSKALLGFRKIVPELRLVAREKNPRSSFYRYIQFRSFLINEEALRFYRDTLVQGQDTTITNKFSTLSANRVLNQLKLVIENNRALYPYKGELNIEQGKDFARLAFTGHYFFNYARGGGLQARLFAGKFLYRGSRTFTKQFATDRYHLNMTGANGYEDYTYSDYFVGRNKFDGIASQQLMVRDGAFKVRTDLLANKIGKTDNWLLAANFSSTFLPPKIPLRVFADIGTYAEAWDRNAATDRFLFDAGFHIPLLKELVNIYVPLIYSRVYRDYIQSTSSARKGIPRLLKTVSFSIDISGFNPRKINRHIEF